MQVSAKLRQGQSGGCLARTGSFFHWCPGCEEMHPLPMSWTFDGNVESPTFTPSFLQQKGTDRQCHYNVTEGQLVFHGDSHHALAGQTVPMPDLPDGYRDWMHPVEVPT